MQIQIVALFFAVCKVVGAEGGRGPAVPGGSSVGASNVAGANPEPAVPGGTTAPTKSGDNPPAPDPPVRLQDSPEIARSSTASTGSSPSLSRGGPKSNWATPSVAEIRAVVKKAVAPDASVFWTAGAKTTARVWARDHGKVTVFDTGKNEKYGIKEYWSDWRELSERWCAIFAQETSGTVWVVFQDLNPINNQGLNRFSFWNEHELPELIKSGRPQGKRVDEIIQVSAVNMKRQIQIWPVNIRRYPANQCRWVGEAPQCRPSCPQGTESVAKSFYGPGLEKCQVGYKAYCCRSEVVAMVDRPGASSSAAAYRPAISSRPASSGPRRHFGSSLSSGTFGSYGSARTSTRPRRTQQGV